MLRESRRLTGFDEQRCFDIVHDATVKAIRSMPQVQDRQHLEAWTKVLIKSVVYDLLKKTLREQTKNRAYVQLTYTLESEQQSNHSDEYARLLWIEQEIERLPLKLKELFELRYRLGWTLTKIAKSIGLKAGAVDGQLQRAIRRIQLQAEENFGEE